MLLNNFFILSDVKNVNYFQYERKHANFVTKKSILILKADEQNFALCNGWLHNRVCAVIFMFVLGR